MSQAFYREVLDLEFYPYEHKCDFKKSNETLPSKTKFESSLSYREELDLEFYPYGHKCDFKKSNETLPSKTKSESSLSGNGIRENVYQ